MPPRNRAGVAGAAVRSGPQEVLRVPAAAGDIPRVPLAVQDTLGPELVKVTEEALAAAGIDRSHATSMGCVVASHHATAATAQYIAAVLDGAGPRWLAPQCFLYYSPHSLTGRLCIDLGLDGTAITLTGVSSGVDALGYAAMMITSGRCPGVLVAAAHWPTPAPASEDRSTRLTVAATVLTADRGLARVSDWQPGGGHPAVAAGGDRGATSAPGEQPPDVTAPLAELAAWYPHCSGDELTLAAGGSRVSVLRGAPR